MTESKCSSVLRIQYSPNLWGQPVLYLCVVMYLSVPAYYSRYSYHHRPRRGDKELHYSVQFDISQMMENIKQQYLLL